MKIKREQINSLPQLDRIELRQRYEFLEKRKNNLYINPHILFCTIIVGFIIILFSGQLMLASMQDGLIEEEIIFFQNAALKFLTISYIFRWIVGIGIVLMIVEVIIKNKNYRNGVNKLLSEYFEVKSKVKRNERGNKN